MNAINTVELFCKINRARVVPGVGFNHLPKYTNEGLLFAPLEDQSDIGQVARCLMDGDQPNYLLEPNWPGINPRRVNPHIFVAYLNGVEDPDSDHYDNLNSLRQHFKGRYLFHVPPKPQTEFWEGMFLDACVAVTSTTWIDPVTGLYEVPVIRWLPEVER